MRILNTSLRARLPRHTGQLFVAGTEPPDVRWAERSPQTGTGAHPFPPYARA